MAVVGIRAKKERQRQVGAVAGRGGVGRECGRQCAGEGHTGKNGKGVCGKKAGKKAGSVCAW